MSLVFLSIINSISSSPGSDSNGLPRIAQLWAALAKEIQRLLRIKFSLTWDESAKFDVIKSVSRPELRTRIEQFCRRYSCVIDVESTFGVGAFSHTILVPSDQSCQSIR